MANKHFPVKLKNAVTICVLKDLVFSVLQDTKIIPTNELAVKIIAARKMNAYTDCQNPDNYSGIALYSKSMNKRFS